MILNRELLKKYFPHKCNKTLSKVKTLPDIFKVKTDSLSLIRKNVGEEAAEGYVESWIINIVEAFNVGKSMNETQITDTAQLILSEYWMLTISDVYYVFKQAKLGRYGKIYDRLDVGVIMEWFKIHTEERYNLIESQRSSENSNFKEDLPRISKKNENISHISLSVDELKEIGSIKDD